MSHTLHQGVLAKYKNDVFVETGSFWGGGIEAAVYEPSFQTIYSVEIDPKFYEHCQRVWGGHPKVRLYLGDSAKVIPVILGLIDRPTTFWLDAHDPQDGSVGQHEGWRMCPALLELQAIERHPIKTHTIMIDDRFDFGTAQHDNITEDQLQAQLRKINPNYRFVYETGAHKDSVIVAVP